jgi:hypothetical protein
MLIMQRSQRREQQLSRAKGLPIQCCTELGGEGEERDLYPLPITTVTHVFLRNVGLLKYYEEATS